MIIKEKQLARFTVMYLLIEENKLHIQVYKDSVWSWSQIKKPQAYKFSMLLMQLQINGIIKVNG